MQPKGSPTANRRSLCHGWVWLKEGTLVWLVLFCTFLAGGSAGSFLGDPCWSLDRWSGNIESHQAMLADKPGDFSNTAIHQTANTYSATIEDHSAFVNPATDCTVVWILADNAQERLAKLETVPDSDLDLSVLIAQCHFRTKPAGDVEVNNGFPLISATVVRTLRRNCQPAQSIARYKADFQKVAIRLFSCLRDADFVLKGTHFGSISCLRPLVLKCLAATPYPIRASQCAGAVNAWQPQAVLSAHLGWLIAARCDPELSQCDPDDGRSHPAAYYSPTCQTERRSLSAAPSKEKIAVSDYSPVKYAPNQQRAQYATAHFSTETLDRLSSPTI
jgi:hypothetical protein